MKIAVLTKGLKQNHKDLIEKTAGSINASVCFADSENDLTEGFEDPDIIYGFGIETARTNKNLKWLCVPSAGIDYLMKPGCFANEGCILTNSAGAYGVSIAEHIIAVTLMMMRRITEFHLETDKKIWGSPRAQKSIKDSRITVLTPHVAGNLTLDHTMNRNVEMFCEDLLNYAGGLPLKHEVDRRKGY